MVCIKALIWRGKLFPSTWHLFFCFILYVFCLVVFISEGRYLVYAKLFFLMNLSVRSNMYRNKIDCFWVRKEVREVQIFGSAYFFVPFLLMEMDLISKQSTTQALQMGLEQQSEFGFNSYKIRK